VHTKLTEQAVDEIVNTPGTTGHAEDRHLTRRMIKGEDAAIIEFMDIYFPRLYRFALSRLNHNATDAEDVVQQTLTIAARRISTYRGEAALMTWLAQICRRELVRYQKQNQRRERVVALFDDEPLAAALFETLADEESDNPTKFSERSELVSMVHLVMDQLPGRHGDVLEWKYIDGLSINEIASRLDIGAEAVQSLLARARRTFKQGFASFYELYYQEV
jgi:RNA polymerase sigma-70 factor, ECF subfamily